MTGWVVCWHGARGVGKVRGLDRAQYFVAAADLVDARSLAYGQPVRFRATRTERGPRARDVRLASDPTAAADSSSTTNAK
jgi:cold shock CspA family protein